MFFRHIYLDNVDYRLGAFMFQQFCFRTEFLHQTQLSFTFLLHLLIYILLLLLLIPLLLLWSESQVEGGEGGCKGGSQMEKVLWGCDMLCTVDI